MSSYSEEGRLEAIRLELDAPAAQPVSFEVFEFHYHMRPELAPEEDTWPHARQMKLARESDAATAPQLDADDAKIALILSELTPTTVPLQPTGDASYAATWTARHGRFYFRFRIGDEVLKPVYTMRVHCSHADLRRVEMLKERLAQLQLPLGHRHGEMAEQLFPSVAQTYRQGHGLRFMMLHHEEDASPLDTLFASLEGAVAGEDWERAEGVLEQLKLHIAKAERLFRATDVSRRDGVLQIRPKDLIGFDYVGDDSTAVYVRLPAETVSPPFRRETPSAHDDHQAAPDRAALTKGAVRLEVTGGTFQGRVPAEWDRLEVVVIYGLDKRYYWTERIE